MSWDVFFQDLPAGIRSIEEIPDDFQPGPIGSCPMGDTVLPRRSTGAGFDPENKKIKL